MPSSTAVWRNLPNEIPAETKGWDFQVADQVNHCAGLFHVNRLIAAFDIAGRVVGALTSAGPQIRPMDGANVACLGSLVLR